MTAAASSATPVLSEKFEARLEFRVEWVHMMKLRGRRMESQQERYQLSWWKFPRKPADRAELPKPAEDNTSNR